MTKPLIVTVCTMDVVKTMHADIVATQDWEKTPNNLRGRLTSQFFINLVKSIEAANCDPNYLEGSIKAVQKVGVTKEAALVLVGNLVIGLAESVKSILPQVDMGYSSGITYDLLSDYDLHVTVYPSE